MLTKKNVLLTSGAVSILLLFVDRMGTYQLCGGSAGSCVDTLFNASMILFVLPFIFFFSLITYYLPEAVFRAWVNFAKWWVPAQILLVSLVPDSSGGYFVVLMDKQFAAIILSAVLTLISLGIVVWKLIATRSTTGRS